MRSRREMIAASLYCGAMPFLRGQNMFGNAEAYERFMGRWSSAIAPLLVDFAKTPDRGRILDVGSGTGALANAILKRKPGAKVTGIDPSAEYVAYAKSRNTFGDRATFETGDAQALRFAEREFVASLSLLVFNFIPGLKRTAQSHPTWWPDRGGRVGSWRWNAYAASVLGRSRQRRSTGGEI